MDDKIFEKMKEINQQIHSAAIKVGRKFSDIKLIAVTKTLSLENIRNAVNSGLNIFGENRVQEAEDKISRLNNPSIKWHMIGHLQSNKAKLAVELFDLIHSVDSVGLAKALNEHAGKKNEIQKILVQVKLSDEINKSGTVKDKLLSLLEAVSAMGNLEMHGLMTIPPYFENPEMARPYFIELRKLRDMAAKKGFNLPELSMGMTNDFKVAIEEGSTMVRIGTGIFGERK